MTGTISIVIAAYNEETRIGGTLRRIRQYVTERRLDCEIIVVDDGSGDGTAALVQRLAEEIPALRVIRYEPNRGKGYALRTGVLASKGELVLVSDADLSTPIEELEVLWPHLSDNACQVAIGSRALALSQILEKQPWWRRGMGKTFNKIVKLMIMDDFNDTQCGFKLFRGGVARTLFAEARIDRFAYDVEVLALAKKHGHRVAEVPIKWINSPGSKVHPVFDSLQMLKDLCRIRMCLGSVKNARPCAR
ncbi:glycosyltransferase family 2 protein [Geobacter hydrogenophilus]|uniref:dolichyl-phosphate beta-glucosyltransferase n=1 Tax=Geobacter hydrogenophilus TaxID=40983 RepID=A0A9W6LDF3_9BACT|nr:dolichyl-phosphate beta-glucosyltransferase [Geobacter hydrogenophilus]MBT0893243.1 glycosyltransferase family 2 protein [Geobacter hydrogenophilus]GLI38910.1 glycosyl transferase [Geobacter hydrogenophilus]